MEITFQSIDTVDITDELCEKYSALRTQLKGEPYAITKKELEAVKARKDSELLVLLFADGVFSGMAQVSFIAVPQSYSGYVNAVVVDEAFRGQGLGTVLMQEVEKRAKERWETLKHFILTSAPKRGTHGFYVRLGYRPRTKDEGDETTFFIKDLA